MDDRAVEPDDAPVIGVVVFDLELGRVVRLGRVGAEVTVGHGVFMPVARRVNVLRR